MKIKKFVARTEQEALEKAKAELGSSALILNIKKITPKGILKLFKKPTIEVTAAYEDKQKEAKPETKLQTANTTNENSEAQTEKKAHEKVLKDKTIVEQGIKIESLQNKVNATEQLVSKLMTQLTLAEQSILVGKRKYENSMIQLFYDELIEQGVTPEIAEKILEDINLIEEEDKIDINLIVKIVYNTIISVLGEPSPVLLSKTTKDNAKVITLLGPTGVGKTTTIAKLSSIFMLKQGLNVSLITADTYRIAAVEQLKTYAEILGIDIQAVYNNDEMPPAINKVKKINDIILIDTAGRSHKNMDNLIDIKELLEKVPNSENYLVLSVTTKFEDLLSIVESYSTICDFKIIFTKLDETNAFGSILNICYLTGKKVSYVTMGQNVPDDIEIIQPEKIAKMLLGLGGGAFWLTRQKDLEI